MNPLEIIRSKTTNEREKEKLNIKILDLNESANINITIRKLSKNKFRNNLKLSTLINSNKKIAIKKNINKNNRPLSSKIISHNMPINNSKKELGHHSSKRRSLGLVQRKTLKYYSKFSIKNERYSIFKSKKVNPNTTSLNALEKNIKNVINDIRVKIEKKK